MLSSLFNGLVFGAVYWSVLRLVFCQDVVRSKARLTVFAVILTAFLAAFTLIIGAFGGSLLSAIITSAGVVAAIGLLNFATKPIQKAPSA